MKDIQTSTGNVKCRETKRDFAYWFLAHARQSFVDFILLLSRCLLPFAIIICNRISAARSFRTDVGGGRHKNH